MSWLFLISNTKRNHLKITYEPKTMAIHYAGVERGNESNPHDEWGITSCGLELDSNSLTDREDWVTCKNCLKSIAKYDQLSNKICLRNQLK